MPSRLHYNADLKPLNTFGVAARAWALAQVNRWLDLEDILAVVAPHGRPLMVLGGGSNVLFRADYPGVIIQIANRGRDILRREGDHVFVRVAAGEDWHDTVRWTADQKLWGIENLALIPGRVGAAPIQNIGAYGTELAESLVEVKCYDLIRRIWRTLPAEDCGLGYRSSRFRDVDAGRFVISECTLKLSTRPAPRLDYYGVAAALAGKDLDHLVPLDLVEAISAIRRQKLPDPATAGNAGSFFKNPTVDLPQAEKLKASFPELPVYPAAEGQAKLSAAWMIDHLKWRGRQEGNAVVSERHALVIVNHGNATGEQVWRLAQDIQTSVRDTFGLNLEPEPIIV
ncbi:MAG: UDP-N-acetylmuramate dehydrogenase [Pseudomonadota bacterium]